MSCTRSSPFFTVGRKGTPSGVLVPLFPVCQPSFVLPPSFDSDLVELFKTKDLPCIHISIQLIYWPMPNFSIYTAGTVFKTALGFLHLKNRYD